MTLRFFLFFIVLDIMKRVPDVSSKVRISDAMFVLLLT